MKTVLICPVSGEVVGGSVLVFTFNSEGVCVCREEVLQSYFCVSNPSGTAGPSCYDLSRGYLQ